MTILSNPIFLTVEHGDVFGVLNGQDGPVMYGRLSEQIVTFSSGPPMFNRLGLVVLTTSSGPIMFNRTSLPTDGNSSGPFMWNRLNSARTSLNRYGYRYPTSLLGGWLPAHAPPIRIPPFDPNSVGNLQVWFDGTNTSSVILDSNSNVSEWIDLSNGGASTSGNNISQPTVTKRPGYSNGTLSFDGFNDVLFRRDSGGILNAASGEIFVVFNTSNVNTVGTLFAASDSAGPNTLTLRATSPGVPSVEFTQADDTDTTVIFGDTTLINNVTYLGHWASISGQQFIQGGDTYTIDVNGSGQSLGGGTSQASGDWMFETTSKDTISVGALQVSSTEVQYHVGGIREILIYETPLSPENRSRVTTEMILKHNIPVTGINVFTSLSGAL